MIKFIKRLLCNHNEITHCDTEEEVVFGKILETKYFSCTKCGFKFHVRRRV